MMGWAVGNNGGIWFGEMTRDSDTGDNILGEICPCMAEGLEGFHPATGDAADQCPDFFFYQNDTRRCQHIFYVPPAGLITV